MSPAGAPLRARSRSWPCTRPSVFSMLVMPLGQDHAVHLSGTFAAESVADFRACIAYVLDLDPRQLIVELSAVQDIDDAAAAALVAARDTSASRDTRFIVDSPPASIRQRLDEGAFFVR